MSLRLRTISQLDELTATNDDMQFGVSVPVDGSKSFSSKKLAYKTIKADISSDVEANIASKYGLNSAVGHDPVNVSDLSAAVYALSAENCSLFGRKTFMTPPLIEDDVIYGKTVTVLDNMLPTVAYVKSMVENNGDYLTDDMVVVG